MMDRPAFLSGNMAMARGAWEAGVRFATGYPGTPSTEILESLAGLEGVDAHWAANEKVGFEEAMGFSIAGGRALVTMKHVGLNVAADPFMVFPFSGTNGGFVVVSADDPGMHSSQNEQDNRNLARMARVPILEPADPQECHDLAVAAFELSETFGVPVMVALGATVRLVGRRRERLVDVEDLYRDDGLANLNVAPGEVLADVRLPAADGWHAAYLKLRPRCAFDFPALGVAAALRIGGGRCADARIVLGAVAPRPLRVREAEAELIGAPIGAAAIGAAAEAAYRAAKPVDNTDLPPDYRRQMVRVYVARALRHLVEPAAAAAPRGVGQAAGRGAARIIELRGGTLMEGKHVANRVDRPREWRSSLAMAVAGILVFETLSGLSIYLLPFSVPNQVTVVAHTVFGLLLLAPFMWYQVRHWRTYRHSYSLTHVKLVGYLGLVLTALCIASGVVLTWQALFGIRIGYRWDLVHLLSTIGVIGFTVPHVVLIVWRDWRLPAADELHAGTRRAVLGAERRFARSVALVVLAGFGTVAAGAVVYRPVRLVNEFPADYNYLFGKERPFVPSLARTDTNGAFDPRLLAGSESCGTSKCHEDIVKEWLPSAHRYASMDVGFQKIQQVMAEQNGAESTRYCGGCHDPISLFSGSKNVFVENLSGLHGYQEGVSCLACHSIRETDVKGNANYVISQPKRYLFELHEPDNRAAMFARDFLIRAYPRQHVDSLTKRSFKTPEFCAACHKQFIDQEVNQVGWVQLQNQFDNWRKSRWNHPGDAAKTVECRECHMPLQASDDPAAGDGLDYNRTAGDGKHRSHRFIAANQMIPALMKLPGADEQVRLTRAWLRGEIEIPEIAEKWESGPAVTLDLDVPPQVAPGEEVRVKARVTSNKVGHDFPTGPLDIIQSWVEIVVKDDHGTVVFQSGTVDAENFIQQGSFIFKAEGVDQHGNLIDRHNLWEMVGVRFRRSLFPGFSDAAEYTFGCPSSVSVLTEGADAGERVFTVAPPPGAEGGLHVTARLRYRKYDQFLLNYMFGKEAGITAPVTDMAEAEATIPIIRREPVNQ